MADPTATALFGVPINSALQTASQAAPQINTPAPLPPPRQPKRRGIIDDTLGFLGDFLLSRLRMGTPYRDAKRNEKLQIAAEGFEQNPSEGFKRLAEVDFGAATKLRDQYIDNERLAAQNAATSEARASRLEAAKTVQNDRTRDRVGRMLDTMESWDSKRQESGWSAMRQKALDYASKQGLDLSSELPETYNLDELDSFISGSVPTGTQRSQRLVKERIENQDQQAGARVAATIRGQDISSADRAAGRAVAIRGQDIRSDDAAAARAAADKRAANRPTRAPKTPKPTASDISYLRSNPDARDKFDGRFGVGMSKRILGN